MAQQGSPTSQAMCQDLNLEQWRMTSMSTLFHRKQQAILLTRDCQGNGCRGKDHRVTGSVQKNNRTWLFRRYLLVFPGHISHKCARKMPGYMCIYKLEIHSERFLKALLKITNTNLHECQSPLGTVMHNITNTKHILAN